MTPFTSRPGGVFKARVYNRHGASCVRSLGTNDPETATDVSAFLKRLRKQRRWDALDLIYAGELRAGDAYDADREGRLAQLIESIQTKAQERADVDLSPLVKEWDGRGKRSRSLKYVTQVRQMIPKGKPFPHSRFTSAAVTAFLDGLSVSDSTRNRYRSALLQFGRWLVKRGVLQANVVREADGYTEVSKGKEPIFLEPHQVKALVWKLPEPFRSLEALMAGTGMEWSAVMRTTRRDVDLATRIIFAKGEKNQPGRRSYRIRYVECSEDWAWQLVRAHVKKLPPESRLFDMSEEDALREHHRAAEALELQHTTLHHHRHSFAVMHIRRRTDDQWIKRQLGHSPRSQLLYTTYGVYIEEAKMRETASHSASPKRKRAK